MSAEPPQVRDIVWVNDRLREANARIRALEAQCEKQMVRAEKVEAERDQQERFKWTTNAARDEWKKLLAEKVVDEQIRAEKAEARVKDLESLLDQATDVHAVLIGRAEKAEAAIRSALGEDGDFPPLPDDWPKRPYYWRSWLRGLCR
jgi:translation elongation factor EF-Ts